MPAAVMKVLRAQGSKTPDPITLTPKLAKRTSRPIVDYVLCAECEDLFSKNGETWVGANMAREGSFPLRDPVQKAIPIESDRDYAVYASAQIPEINVDKLVYFGLSVFWHSSAHVWKGIEGLASIELGPYQKPIRQFLRGEGAFPANTVVAIKLWPDNPSLFAHFPMRLQSKGFHYFYFHIPGIEFLLCTRQRIPTSVRSLCAQTQPLRPIIVERGINKSAIKMMAQTFQTAYKPETLRKFLTGPDPRHTP